MVTAWLIPWVVFVYVSLVYNVGVLVKKASPFRKRLLNERSQMHL